MDSYEEVLKEIRKKHEDIRQFLDKQILYISAGALVLSANVFINQQNLINTYILILSLLCFLFCVIITLVSYHIGEKIWAFLYNSSSNFFIKKESNLNTKDDNEKFKNQMAESDKKQRIIQNINLLSLFSLILGMVFLLIFAILKIGNKILDMRLWYQILGAAFSVLTIIVNTRSLGLIKYENNDIPVFLLSMEYLFIIISFIVK